MVNLIPGLSGLNYSQKLEATNLDSLADRRRRQDMVTVYRIISGIDRVDPTNFFQFYNNDSRTTRTSSYHWNIVPQRYRTEVWGNHFSNRVATHWNSLPEAIKSSPTVATFKSRYDKHINMQE